MVITAYRPLSAEEPTFPQAKVTDLFISSSYKYHKYFYEVGSFTLVVPANVPTVDLITEDMILSVDGKDSLIVTDISSTEKEYTFKGYDLKYLLHLRLTLFPQKEQDAGTYGYYVVQGSTEHCIKELVQYNITAAADKERRIYGFAAGANRDRGLASDTYMTRLEYLDEVVATMCKNASVGYDIRIDFENNKYLFDVIEPVDKTDSQHDRNSVVFAKQFCNVVGLKRETGTSSEKNAIYAINGGGTADKVVKCVLRDKANVPAGVLRREVTVNTSAELATEVDTYALKEAEDFVKTDSFELDTAAVLEYGVLFDVGDKVTFKYNDLYLDSVILEAQIERSGDSNKVTLVAGNKKPKTLNSIGNKTGTLENNVNSAKIDGMGGDKILPLSQFAANEDGSYTVNGVNYGFGTDKGTGFINKVFEDEKTFDIDIESADVNSSTVDFNTMIIAIAISKGLGCVQDSEKTSIYEVEITADGGQVFLMNENGAIVLEHATIDWGDGSSEEYSTRSSYLHTYKKAGTYRISITADLTTLWGGFQARSNAVLKSVIRFANCVTMLGDLPRRSYDGNFEYITLPKSITELHVNNFNNCQSLKNIYGLEQITEIGENCFSWQSLQGAEIVLPKCTSIGENAFVNTGIVKLDAPELTSIGSSALNSTKIKYLNAPKLTNLNECMIYCDTIEEAHLEGLTTISTSDLCGKTMTLFVSPSLNYIRSNAFNNSIITIEYSGTQEQWDAIEKQEYWDTGATITLHCNG